tara:strand:+ start:1239 stop:1436 length:198 start_codon:yes stop_codon:yes gene_type:complete
MDFSSHNLAVIAIAADMLGWTKSVNTKEDGTLEWYGESSHPTDSEMNAKMSEAQTEYNANGPKDS